MQNIHTHSFIHCDIKPSNILIGTGQQASIIYLIDFSIAKLYRDPSTHRHNAFKECCGSLGSPAFSAVNSHLGCELGRWDDIESLAYVLLYFACGTLLWLGHTPSLEHVEIANMKQEILQRDDIPKALLSMLSYSRSLPFMQRPDYDYLRMLLKGLCTNPLDLTTQPEWLFGEAANTPSVYESCPLVGETSKLVGRSAVGERQRYVYYSVFKTRLECVIISVAHCVKSTVKPVHQCTPVRRSSRIACRRLSAAP